MVRNLPAMQETWVRSLRWEDQYSSEIPWTEEPGGLQPLGPQRVGHSRRASKESGAVALRLTDLKPTSQANSRETRAGADAAIWRQNPFSRNPQEYLRRQSSQHELHVEGSPS